MGIAQVLKRAIVAYQATGGDSILSQNQTNGNSQLGTLHANAVPKFLTDNPMPNGYPWSTMSPKTNYYSTYPETGVIRSYDFHVTRGKLSPDGYEREVMLVNGAFPGPLIEANWGDTIQVTVHNDLENEGTAMHWHGFLQKGTPWEDGVPSISQCPLAPGQCFTYQFKASLYGTSWYHSHYSSQYAGGLAGPIIIHGPRTYEYDIDLGPVTLSDWFHDDYLDLVKKVLEPKLPPGPPVFSDNNLINGKNSFDCALKALGDETPCASNAPLSKFRFEPGKTHLLRLVNIGAEALQRFSIDGHTMTVVSNDFVDIEPYETKVVTLGVGQRSDVLVTADGDPAEAYWMRANISVPCSATRAPKPYALAAVYYDGVSTESVPESSAWDVPDPATCMNDDLELTRPVMELPLPEPDLVLNMDIRLFRNASNITVWSLGNNETFRGNYNSPTLLLSNLGNHTFENEWNVINTKDAAGVRVVVHNKFPLPHPMHLHGFNMYILAVGAGNWNGTIVNPHNPMRRDVIQIPGNGHLVIQFDASHNPGVWPFHCHIAWHASGGLFAQFLTAPDKVSEMKIPNVVAETCRQWGRWTHTNIPDQIDSGL